MIDISNTGPTGIGIHICVYTTIAITIAINTIAATLNYRNNVIYAEGRGA
jgi:hypothetical protein